MEWLICKACGSSAIIPMDVEVENVDLSTGEFDVSEIDDDSILDLDEGAEEAFESGEMNDDNLEADESALAESLTNGEQESRFYSCHVCGDNWLAVKEQETEGCQVTFIHQMGMAPVLKRVAHMQTHIVINESTVENWKYYLDDEMIDETAWLAKLNDRRQVLKSVCSN
jgi:hypothetical protein